MKKIIILLFIVLSSSHITAQEYNFSYGKVTMNELCMKSYSKDTTATAVTIYKNADIGYEYGVNDFQIEYYYETKIKIIKSEGNEYANIAIPFFDNDKSGSSKEYVSKIEAYAYNLENGKIVKTKMNKSYIFEEKLSNNWKQIKFSIPSVKAGTVIEYKYKLTSDFSYNLSDCIIQQNIPIIHYNYEIRIPEYFDFNIETSGAEDIKVNKSYTNQSISIKDQNNQFQTISFNSQKLIITGDDLPALKDEPNVWCADDFRSQVKFELRGTKYPNSMYKPYTSSWEKINELLKEEESFGRVLKMRNPYKDAMQTMNLSAIPTTEEKVRTLFKFLKNKISWNEKYKFYSSDVKKAIKEGSGSNADINFILISMLKDAGINAYPVMLSRRTEGRLPMFFPSINKLTTFIVGIQNTDSTSIYLDGSIKNGDIDILPPSLMVERARVYDDKGTGSWVDLSNIGKHYINALITGSITPEGTIKGERTVSYIGEQAAAFRNAFKAAKDSTAFIEKTESEDGISIKEYTSKNVNSLSAAVNEKLTFTKEAMSNDGHIYLNPMIFPHLTKNQFIKEERKLPVEFDYPYTFKLTSVLKIPEGYQVEEIPKAVKINLNDEGCSCLYNVQVVENQIMVRYIFILKRILYTKDEYTTLRNFWGTVVDKNNEQIVLKKITQQPAENTKKQTSQL